MNNLSMQIIVKVKLVFILIIFHKKVIFIIPLKQLFFSPAGVTKAVRLKKNNINQQYV